MAVCIAPPPLLYYTLNYLKMGVFAPLLRITPNHWEKMIVQFFESPASQRFLSSIMNGLLWGIGWNEVRFLFFLSFSQVCRCVFFFWSSSTSFRLSSFLLLFKDGPTAAWSQGIGGKVSWNTQIGTICGRLSQNFSRNRELATGTWHGCWAF